MTDDCIIQVFAHGTWHNAGSVSRLDANMDKRYKTISLPQQLELRRKAVSDVIANPQWSLPQAVRHLKKTMHLTSTELAKLAGISLRTLQDLEREKSEGTVQTMNRVFGVLGLKLGVVRVPRDAESGAASVGS